MEWLLKLLGLQNSPVRTHFVADRVDASVAPPTPEPPPAGTPRGWQVSENGNDTKIIGENRVTIYGDGHRWKYCIAIADPDAEAEPFFSDNYLTKDAAREEALAHIYGHPSKNDTVREIREKEQFEKRPEQIASEVEKLGAVKRSVQTLFTKAGSLKTAQNLLHRLKSRRRTAEYLWKNACADEDASQISATWSMVTDYKGLVEQVESYITKLTDQT